MKRRLFNLLAALSLMLCVATVAIWVRSEFVYDDAELHAGRCGFRWRSAYGRMSLAVETWADESPGSLMWMHGRLDDPRNLVSAQWSGAGMFTFECHHGSLGNHEQFTYFEFPDLPLVLVLVIAPIGRAWFDRLAAKRRNDHTCEMCGYDLRATPDRCPECGTTISAQENG